MSLDKIDRGLPWIKTNAVYALTRKYTNETQALAGHRHRSGRTVSGRARASAQAIDAVQQIYTNNFFPEMKASWNGVSRTTSATRIWPGCFRCHDGKHKTADGKRTIKANDCNACHTILAQGSGDELNQLTPGAEIQASRRRSRRSVQRLPHGRVVGTRSGAKISRRPEALADVRPEVAAHNADFPDVRVGPGDGLFRASAARQITSAMRWPVATRFPSPSRATSFHQTSQSNFPATSSGRCGPRTCTKG